MATSSESKNVLNADVEFKGTIRFAGELAFDGKIDGDIQSEGALNLGDNAVIKGTINAKSVVVRGKVTGNITASEKIDMKTKTELFGDIRAPRLSMEEGVTFVGQTEVNPGKAAPTPAPAGRETAVKAATF